MRSLFTTCFLASWVCIATRNYGVLGSSALKEKSFPEASEVFQIFSDIAAISDANNDTILECMIAKRTYIDLDSNTAVYTWTLKSQDGEPGEKISFFVRGEAAPGIITVYPEDDPTPREGVYLYTDYENCLTFKMEYRGNICLLWVQRELKDSVPQHCIDHFVADCGAVVPLYSQDLCFDGEGDY
ncbi:uncharacterized protein LOC144152748 [Haemaphysalis longicornis]